MAKYTMELPTEIMQDIRKIEDNADGIFSSMTKAAAEACAANVRANAPNKELANAVRVSRTYKTPSDDGINNKVYFGGYLPFSGNRKTFARRGKARGKIYEDSKGIPMDFLAKVTEYGTSPRYTDYGLYRGYIGKKPFFRKGFRPDQIEQIMRDVQKRESGGLLE